MTETQAPTDAEAGPAAEAEATCAVGAAGEAGCDADSTGEVEWYQQPLSTDAEAAADPALAPPPLTPAQAFDALYSYCAPTLVQQTYLLTGSLRQARDAVERAFQQAWQRWPEVAVDPDPAGWVRAVAHDCALSPWHRLRHRLPVPFRGREPGPAPASASKSADPTGRALLAGLQNLRPPYRRALVLYDGVGLDLPETAAESEASTPATAGRVRYARAVVTACLPEPATPDDLHRLLTELAADVRPRPTRPIVLRTRADLRARRWIHAAVVFASVLLTTTALTLRTAPDRYEPPVPPGAPVSGVPPQAVPGPLSHKQLKLRSKLRAAMAAGPGRLHPEAR
ncbi:RNA polymerase sigma factor [Streptomyces sp. MA5143a]|uniref:RNA polymerase sigma factor n=1 Tax=Streptomyces sp. MA5143a TaxID=2083010 RepID=UPI000D2717F4|nr:RNA polymerase subunit sigma-70 [Streptomyces sp. MA5143a]SPF02379.1 RNA polymerase sigma factor SigJ [Streptomyces sp. MA5143a]